MSTKEVAEPEVVEEAESLQQEFDQELRQEVLERDMHRCQICGNDQNLEVSHIQSGYEDDREGKDKKDDQGHRGMGGKKSVNRPENLITLCKEHHDKLDARSGKSIKVERWVPSDDENGLIVLNNQMRRIDQDDLYFYNIPSNELIEQADEVHNDLMDSLDTMLDSFHSSLELLYWIKEKDLYKGIPSPEKDADFYTSFKGYYLDKVKSKFGTKLTLNSVYSYHSAIEPLIERVDDPEKRHQIRRGNLPALGTVLNSDSVDEGEKSKAIEMAKDRQDEFKKFKRDLEIDNDNANRVKSCKSCIVPEKWDVQNLQGGSGMREAEVGGNKPNYCSVSGHIIEFMSRTEAEKVASDCDKFDPED